MTRIGGGSITINGKTHDVQDWLDAEARVTKLERIIVDAYQIAGEILFASRKDSKQEAKALALADLLVSELVTEYEDDGEYESWKAGEQETEYARLGTTSTVDKLERRSQLRCSFCRPNRNENASRKPKHGVRKKR